MGTNYLAPTWRQPENTNKDKLSNYSIDFDGTIADDIELGTTTFLLPGQPSSTSTSVSNPKFSASIFFNFNSSVAGTTACMIGAGQAGGAQYWYLRKDSNDNLQAIFRITNGTYATITGGTTLSHSTWYHACVTWDGDNINLYLNGVSDATQVAATTFYYGSTIPHPSIGSFRYSAYATNNGWKGKLSQATVFDYALSQSQITYLYNLNNPMTITGAEPIAYWPLGDNSNPTATAGYPNIVSAADSVFDFTTNGYITLPTVPELGMAGASNYTANIWVNRDSVSQEGILGYNYANPNGSGWYLWANGTTLTAQLGYDGGTSTPFGTWKYTIPSADFIGSWHMVTMVFDGSQTGQDILKVYYDGVEPAGAFYTDANFFPSVLPNGVSADQNRNVYLGVLQTGTDPAAGLTGYLFNGQMSNAEFWKDSLTSAEVLTLYNNGQPLDGGQPEADKLRAWYKLNQSAVLTPGNPTNWTITKIGSPAYASGDDGGWAQNGILKSQDTNSYTISSGDYFQWNSPTIYTSGSNIVLSSSGGSAIGGGVGVEVIYQYNIDDSSWVTWHQHSDTSYGGGTYTVPSTSNLTVSNNIKIRVQLAGGPSNASEVTVSDINVNGGTSNYNESFDNTTRYGFWNNQDTQPPATFSADHWDIPDNRSAYPQAFAYPVANQGLIYDQSMLSDLNQIQSDITVSCWVKTTDTSTSQTFLARSRVGGPSKDQGWVIGKDNFYGNGGYIQFTVITCADGAPGVPDPSATTASLRNDPASGFPNNDPQGNPLLKVNDGKWHLVSGVYDRSENRVSCYIDGVLQNTKVVAGLGDENMPVFIKATGGGSRTTVGGYNNGSNMTALVKNFKGEISNVKIWDTALSTAEVVSLYNNGFPLDSNLLKPSSLKAWWKLDKSNKYNNLGWASSWNIYNNAYTITDTTDYNYALAKGSGLGTGYIQATSIPSLDITSDTTISIWIKGDVTTGTKALTGGVFGAGGDLALVSDQVLLLRGSSNYKYYSNGPGSRLRDGNWHHVLIYSPGYAQSDIGDVRLFMDGQEILGGATAQGGGPGTIGSNLILQGGFYSPTTSGVVSNAVVWNSNQISQLSEIYNNGSPAASYTNNPIYWVTLENDDTAIGGGLYDKSGNSSTTVKIGSLTSIFSEVKSKGYYALSKDLVESDLIDDNVSTVNGESDTLPGTALVQSDLTRKLPFSNYSINFDGIDGFISVYDGVAGGGPSSLKFTSTDSFSISCWIEMVGTSGQENIISFRGTPLIWLYRNGTSITFRIRGNGSATESFIDKTTTNNAWHNIVAIRDYNGGSPQLKLYIDNVAATPATDSTSGDFDTYDKFSIGNDNYSGGRFWFDGNTSNVAIFNSTLTEDQIARIYNNGVTQDLQATSSFSNNMIAWWPMDQSYTYFNGSVLVARDVINSNDGTGENIIQSDIYGNAPGSEANGIGTNLTIADLKGDMQNSINNSYSINMADYADGVTNPADSGRSTNVP